MSSPIIDIPGFSQPLVLEPCEVGWLRTSGGRFIRTNCFGQAEIGIPHAAAAYEYALRDAVWELLPGAILVRHRPNELWVAFHEAGASVSGDICPTPLHAWRAAARHRQIGPWQETS